MSSSSEPTIIDLKISFLRTQILALSQPLRPSSTFTSISTEENTLRQKAIDDALLKLNGLLKKHNKLAYGPQATRHVAEQVDRLYWNSGERGVNVGGGEGEEWVERGVDLRKEHIIEQMPTEWSEDADIKAPEQAARFRELQIKLTELNEKRKTARERLEGYKAMKELLVPFGEEGAVQDNLVTKNGEVEKELKRMRMLMLRVERGVGALEERPERGEGEVMDGEWENEERRKIEGILGR